MQETFIAKEKNKTKQNKTKTKGKLINKNKID